MTACVACLRRTRLIADLSPVIERRFRGDRPSGLLALEDEQLVHTLTGTAGTGRPRVSDDELLQGCARDARALGVQAICRHDAVYPERLRDLADPPAVVHVLGGIDRLRAVLGDDGRRPAVAIVGARRATPEACAIAHRFAGVLAEVGVPVISGMAFGIDAAAHGGALDATRGGPGEATLAVLAAGPERASPARHRALHAQIAARGAVLSELPPGSRPRPWGFPARNRLIAALADVTVVVAAAARSGSLGTARFALDLDRPVGVVPGSLGAPGFVGSNRLLRDEPGATVVLDPEDVVGLLGDRAPLTGPLVAAARDPLHGLDGGARTVAATLLDGPRTVIALQADHGPATVLTGLAELESRGRLERGFDGRVALRSAPAGLRDETPVRACLPTTTTDR